MTICERCHREIDESRCITWEYCGITTIACFACCQIVVIALNQVPIADRAHRLRVLKEQWQEIDQKGGKR